jgi:NAD(P)-dependent dehydrogenase (short-subunit alcohol dehydrogenase family)
MGDLAGKTAVITGGALGIGQEYARRLAADGANIVVADLADMSETKSLVAGQGVDVLAFRCDVSSPEDVDSLRDAVDGVGGADILIHNAGVYPLEQLADATFESWRRVMSINLDSMFLLCKAFVPTMLERGWGRVVGVSTGMFHDGAPGALPYVASKAGIIGFVRSLAGEVGPHGVTVNAVSPGLVRSHGTSGPSFDGFFDHLTGMQAIKRTGLPADIAGAVAFLVSDDASWITGQTLLVDGGNSRL